MHLVHVPTTEAVKKFIEKDFAHFMVEHEGIRCIKVTKRHYLGNIIAMNLCSSLDPSEQYNLPIAETHRLSFLVQGYYPKTLISCKKLQMISRHLELEFKKGFINWINYYNRVSKTGTVSEGIRQFYAHYKLEEDDFPLLHLRSYYDHHLTGKRAI